MLLRDEENYLETQYVPFEIFDWFLLNKELSHFHENIIEKWENLLEDKSKVEEDYHNFLKNYSGFFFNNDYFLFHVISKLRLGADFITDFILVKDEHSNGLKYEFIEIETPHLNPYTKSGKPSARLSGAIQQIQDWRSWLRDNQYQIKKILPTYGMRFFRDANFTFTIIIGNRNQSDSSLEKRRELAEQLNIKIRSFNYLTTLLKSHTFSYSKRLFSTEFDRLPEEIGVGFANPFYKAYSDQEWRNIINNMLSKSHFTAWNAQLFLENRTFNSLFEEFKAQFKKLQRET